MYVYRVVPLIKLPRPHVQLPAYFSVREYTRGQLVQVPLRTKNIPALIWEKESAQKHKQALRKSSFSLRNITKPLTDNTVVSDSFLNTAAYLSEYYYEPLGLVLRHMLPGFFASPTRPTLRMLSELPPPSRPSRKPRKSVNTLLIAPAEKRIQRYTEACNVRHIALAAEQARLDDVIDSCSGLRDGIVSADMGVRKARSLWRKAYEGTLDRVIGTRVALFTPLKDMAAIWIEGQNNNALVSWDQHPKLDARIAADYIGQKAGIPVTHADTLPGVTTFHTAKTRKWNIIRDKTPLAATRTLDMREEIKNANTSILSRKLQTLLADTKAGERKILLYIARKGFASALVCRDCGHVVQCPDCSAPFVFHKQKLVCHHCGRKEVPPRLCPKCESYRIKYLGGGTQRVLEEVQRVAPHLKTARMDGDVTDTATLQEKTLSAFREKDTDVLVGTSMALKEYALPDLDVAAVVMLDTLILLPHWQAQEQAFNAIWRMRAKAEQVLAQTYHPELPLFSFARGDDFVPFFEEELKKRKALGYPPFTQIVRFSYRHKHAEKAEREAHILKQKLETRLQQIRKEQSQVQAEILGPAPGFTEKVAGKYRWYILMKWPQENSLRQRNKILRTASSEWEVVVNPVDII